MRRAVVVGAGYLGRVVADLLAARGWKVTAIVHSPESAGEISGVEARAVDVTDAIAVRENGAMFQEAEAIVYCVSSGRGGPEAYRAAYVTGLGHVFHQAGSARIVFTSSTSVYPQTDGEVVTEERPACPTRETGRILREAEEMVMAQGGVVARLGGIYGPGRSVYLKRFLEGSAEIEGDGSRMVNQIHRDDAAAALAHLATEASPFTIHNVVDDTPMTQREIYELLADFFHRGLPPSGPINRERKRGWSSKRVSNAQMRSLGWAPKYPSYAHSLRCCGASLLDP